MEENSFDRDYALKNNLTPTGKHLVIKQVKNTTLYMPVVDGQEHNPPKALSDKKFTSPVLAQKEIDKYLTTLWDKTTTKK